MTRAPVLWACLLACLLGPLALEASAQSSSPSSSSASPTPSPAPVVVDFTFSPANPRPGDAVVFQDASSNASSNATRQWTFGDGGKATGPTASHAYREEGDFWVRLSIGLRSHERLVRVALPAPVAEFEVDPASPAAGHPVVFIDRSLDEDDAIVNWTWDFGDGSGAFAELRPRHTYSSAGAFTVKLAVVDEAGHRSSVARTVVVHELQADEAPPLPTNVVETEYSTPALPAAALAAALLGLALLLRRPG